MLLSAQAVGVLYQHRTKAKYTLGVWAAATALTILCSIAFVRIRPTPGEFIVANDTMCALFNIAQPCVCVLAILAFLSIPRRPMVYLDGKLVDRELTATVLGRFTFSWAGPMLTAAGSLTNFSLDDLPNVSNYMRSRFLLGNFLRHSRRSRRLGRHLLHLFRWPVLRQVILTVITNFTRMGPQYAMYRLLLLLEIRSRGSQIMLTASLWVAVLASCLFFNAIADSWLLWVGWSQIAIPLRTILSISIFTKSLRRMDVKAVHVGESTTMIKRGPEGEEVTNDAVEPNGGTAPRSKEVMHNGTASVPRIPQATSNLVAVDTQRVSTFASIIWVFPTIVVKLTLSIWFLYVLIGWVSLLAGLLAWSLTIPINAFVSKWYSGLQSQLMNARDRRIDVMAEALQNIRQIKFAAQEGQWRQRIGEERAQELDVQWKAFVYQAGLYCLLIAGPVLLSTVSLLTYAYLNHTLSPSIAFTTIAILGNLELTLTRIPQLITQAIDAWVSVRRIEDYLVSPEKSVFTGRSESISFQDVSLAWPSDAQYAEEKKRFVLENVTLSFPHGEMSVVSGPTGSGKSLLLAAIVGEVERLTGTISLPQVPCRDERFDHEATPGNWIVGSMTALVAQSPWIEPTSIRENILFGLPMDSGRYQQTISACALTRDFAAFLNGDLTDIGSKGVNLSGGQRCRISLARALYSRAAILVLDDVLSSLDAPVGQQIMEALTSELCAGRTRILVTHHLHLCRSKGAYHVVLGSGTVRYAGPFEDRESDSLNGANKIRQAQTVDTFPCAKADGRDHVVEKSGNKFTEDEAKATGGYGSRLFKEYLVSAGGLSLWVLALTCFTGGTALDIGKVNPNRAVSHTDG
ncbi:MAG: hypothetical protein LQ350_007789 [Teloschistes chrysophthalmus]|nr:MAG: hypothetical protein LQ350_007789 [Niorma chrysophthalma]